jgi:hypothetical protein
MLPIDLALSDARDRALPGREQATLNELCRQIVELVRQPPRPSPAKTQLAPNSAPAGFPGPLVAIPFGLHALPACRFQVDICCAYRVEFTTLECDIVNT